MNTQGAFSSEEWQAVQYLPLNMGLLSATSDGHMDDREAFAIGFCIANRDWNVDPLAEEVLRSLQPQLATMWEDFVESPLSGPDGVTVAVRALDTRLSPADALSFKKAMYSLAGSVAMSSGGTGPDAVSTDEIAGLSALVDLLGLETSDLS